MKGFFKILRTILVIMFAVLVAAFAVLYISETNNAKFYGADKALSSWMSMIADETPLNKVAIPGSHDAGTEGILWPGETQTYTIGEQLVSGCRYFDIRVNNKNGELVIFHSVLNGGPFADALADIKDFISEHPTETLLLDFQHFKGGSQQAVYDLLLSELGAEDLLVKNDTALSDLQFIRGLTMGDARGKCIIFWGDRSADNSEYLFLRNDDECTQSGMCLDSYYIGKYHKAGSQSLIEDAYPVYFDKLAQRQAAQEDGIFVLQGQLTDGMMVFGPWSLERKHNPIISEYIRNLKDSDKLESINVVLRDFITPEKCTDIINLNYTKNNIHARV